MQGRFHIFRMCLMLLLLLMLFMDSPLNSQTKASHPLEILEEIRKYRTENEIDILREFSQFLSIPNPASDRINIQKNADHIVSML